MHQRMALRNGADDNSIRLSQTVKPLSGLAPSQKSNRGVLIGAGPPLEASLARAMVSLQPTVGSPHLLHGAFRYLARSSLYCTMPVDSYGRRRSTRLVNVPSAIDRDHRSLRRHAQEMTSNANTQLHRAFMLHLCAPHQ